MNGMGELLQFGQRGYVCQSGKTTLKFNGAIQTRLKVRGGGWDLPARKRLIFVGCSRKPLGDGVRNHLGRERSHLSKVRITNYLSLSSLPLRLQIVFASCNSAISRSISAIVVAPTFSMSDGIISVSASACVSVGMAIGAISSTAFAAALLSFSGALLFMLFNMSTSFFPSV